MNESQRRAWGWLEVGPAWMTRQAASESVAARVTPANLAPEVPVDIATLGWDALRAEISGCERCELSRTRTQTVFGAGNPNARCLVIGEAPGAEEDRLGEAFVGRAGRLLDRMLGAIGCSRERDVFIANVLKCRPPGNRDPQAGEVAECRAFLDRQVAIVAPALIIVLGRFAAQTLLGTDASIASLRGEIHHYQGRGAAIPVVVTYHPAYLLRSPLDKGKAWRDLRRAADVLRASIGASSLP